MVNAFQFSRLPSIYFGIGKLSLLPRLITNYGKAVMLVTGRNSFMKSEQAGQLLETFTKEGIKYRTIIISGEPSPEVIDKTVMETRDEHFDVVAGIGGGSVLDAGKAVSAMMYMKESVKDFLEGVGIREHPGTKIPYIAVPTTSGTGSEATRNAVISSVGKSGFKKSLRHENFVPEIALVDPSLTFDCPASVTAASGMDCFSQLLEAYLSTKASNYTDALALEGFKSIKGSLERSVIDGHDPAARTDMAFAALTSGICLANAGLGAVHGFASSIGGMFNVPHGVVCGTLMAAANEINIRELGKAKEENPALKKYALVGKIFSDQEGRSDEFYIESFLEYIKKLTDDLDLPRLGKFNIRAKDIEAICRMTDIKNNPVKLQPESLKELIAGRL